MSTPVLRGVVAAALLVVTAGYLDQGTTSGQQAPPGAVQDPPGSDFLPRPPVVRQSPEAQQQLFLLPPGFKIAPVLVDPEITDPVGISFDANGRMYVLEMRSYMRGPDGPNSREPNSRISRHEDTNGDGIYEKHTVFADGLVMPRIALPLQDGVVLVLETDNRDLYRFSDTNGDGVADKKEVVFPSFGRVTNMEWQPSGLTWALDNWMYSTYNPFRLRLLPNGSVVREETDTHGGQWGATQDNYGRLWFVDGGTGQGPVNFQVPIAYGAINAPDNFEPNFQEVFGAPGGIGDMQGGMNSVRLPDQTLTRFTAASAPEIYRGHRLPADMVGDLFFTEPVGRMVRRAKVIVSEGLTQLQNAYPQSEFIRSTDPLFRPVGLSSGPDGSMYVVDMYTGIIQDAAFVGPGTYLRRKVLQYGLERQHNYGRIWRVTHDSATPEYRPPQMYSETSGQLVAHLSHPNGWWRDMAQRQLILRQDKSIVPNLRGLARDPSNQLSRIHALWTLEGLGALQAADVRVLLADPDPQVRIQAMRASESLYKGTKGDKSFAADYRAGLKDSDPNVVIQAMLTLNLQRVPQGTELIKAASATSTVRGVQFIGQQLLRPSRASLGQPASNDAGVGYLNLSSEERRALLRGESTYRELCTSCHGDDGKGRPVAGAPDRLLAPPLAGVPRVAGHRNYVLNVLLHGLTGPLDGRQYEAGVMVPMGTNTDEWIADVANYVRNAFGNSGRPLIAPEQVAAVRKSGTRRTPWTLTELAATVPTPLMNVADWTLTASHNAAGTTALSIGAGRWDSATPQEAGMWFQVGLPQASLVTEIQLDAEAGPNRGTGGLGGFIPVQQQGRGGRAAGATPPAAAPSGGAGAGTRGGAPAAPAAPAARGGGGGRGRGGPPATGPLGYTVQVSVDGSTWSAPVAQGTGPAATTIASFPPVQARFIRVSQTGRAASGELWAVQQVRVYVAGR